MMAAIERRGAAVAKVAQARAVARVAEAARQALPGATVTSEDGRVLLSKRGLTRRMADDPALRWPAGWLK